MGNCQQKKVNRVIPDPIPPVDWSQYKDTTLIHIEESEEFYELDSEVEDASEGQKGVAKQGVTQVK
jgi:hypothetical protein